MFLFYFFHCYFYILFELNSQIKKGDYMKTLEMAYIFPFTLMVMVALIFLSFNLHDMLLYKAASYKYLICNNPNSEDYNSTSDTGIDSLKKYIKNFSLTNNSFHIEKEENSINISTSQYNGTVNCLSYDKCDILRKCAAAADIINNITNK